MINSKLKLAYAVMLKNGLLELHGYTPFQLVFWVDHVWVNFVKAKPDNRDLTGPILNYYPVLLSRNLDITIFRVLTASETKMVQNKLKIPAYFG